MNLKKILVIGSCRVKGSVTIVNNKQINKYWKFYKFRPYVHTIEQFLQSIDIIKKNKIFNEDIFSPKYGITRKNKIVKFTGEQFKNIDIFIIEICGVRNQICKQSGKYLHPFPQKYKKHKKNNYKIKYSFEILQKLEKLHKKLNKKPLILISNHNIYKNKYRKELISILKKFSERKYNIKFVNPTEIIKEKGINKCLEDKNHYTKFMKRLLAKQIYGVLKTL